MTSTSILNASAILRKAGLTYREIADRLKVHPKTAQIRAEDESQDVDAGCVHCPTCGEDVPVAQWHTVREGAELARTKPVGSMVHLSKKTVAALCWSEPYREPWWLRALRWVTS